MTSLRVVVDTGSGVAPWRQVHDQVIRLVGAGALAGGARLPPIRRLARDLGLAPGTIARAYRDLELGGWVRTARANGTVVAERGDDAASAERAALLDEAAGRFSGVVRELGLPTGAALSAVERALNSFGGTVPE
ncbi:GntR family transcriptional regulator [Actinosynnema pretiosum subsp. pretiosum]|uniref:GntR family transcriptional regulator n=1 Tax=Actinosynnema pretiosum subsp. pretiosum TaxID=103721 RepID=A0AA45L8Z4_9PSEU|nr:Transcriptional regulator, GntR family [Actinosynnema pretiosum subsp. pretiosum]QUF05829.1 GntR family transcriptional regulator [Actinosynnema pretiosum subsp. pretiosum]